MKQQTTIAEGIKNQGEYLEKFDILEKRYAKSIMMRNKAITELTKLANEVNHVADEIDRLAGECGVKNECKKAPWTPAQG